ncbi:ZYRO0A12870p [Zygosaccharomyces rouxii]|uniref:ZYRO0A12870p n=1 Tax=Zygosaccharomyces rouxii (strain ATCC 2623 / CBS 732 / NBRC 1130 / NCYC 568 / NRRL Y-229) TaxID=559307 RepID=C5DNZ3_ZYGRC|nr:uncharacterized protein ZYRO0A12870g [Zygosaccharomyces rouxii]KAH9198492.1 hypothetical protein LQ764DRAFT_137747 [Zygosaccharomyces rouxii]CAR25984.1 ZYRO0A12870p [Zygosaccharomyces rouxii]
MPKTWQSYTGNSDSSSTYSTDISRPTVNPHRSFFVEDFDGQGPDDEGSRRGLSVYLDDTRLTVPPTPSDLNSSAEDISSQAAIADRSGATNEQADHSENTNHEYITNLSPGVVAYRTVNDSAYSGQSSEDLQNFNAGVAAFTHINRPLPSVIAEGPDENSSCRTGENQSDLENYDRYPHKPKYNDRDEQEQPLQPAAEFDNERQIPPLDEPPHIKMDTQSIESSIKDSLNQRFEDAACEIDTSNEDSNETRQTISTSILINERDSLPSRSSIQYPPIEATSSRIEPSDIDIDRRVEELETEAQRDIPPGSYGTRLRSEGFILHDLKISQRESTSPQDESKKKHVPRNLSLLSKILIPAAPDYTGTEIPVLRSVGSPRVGQQEIPKQLEEQEEVPVEEPQSISPTPQRPEPAQVKPIERSRPTSRSEGLTYSQVDLALEVLKQFQEELKRKTGLSGDNSNDNDNDDDDNNDNDNDNDNNDDDDDNSIHNNNSSCDDTSYHNDKGYVPKTMPFQRVDSNAIDSKIPINFWQKFSIWRVLLVIFTCILFPPFFFMIAAGHKLGFSDFRIIKLITHPSYRARIWKGFLWDISVRWFRWLCLILGIIETLGIFAGIAVGFGVSLGAE